MRQVDLLKNYPKSKRKLTTRAKKKTPAVSRIARKFGKQYFDGHRKYGYGGYSYHPRFWQQVVKDFAKHYGLDQNSRVLDVGCAKGFMMYDFTQLIPDMHIEGIDISDYAIAHALPSVKPFIQQADAKKLPFADNSFDLVISINTIHNLPLSECKQALQEIERVSSKNSFITVDAYRTDEEKKRLEMWNLTALTYMHIDDWIKLFNQVGYTGDYYWFIP